LANISERSIRSLGNCSTEKIRTYNEDKIKDFDFAKEVISGVRNYRQSKGISPRELKFSRMFPIGKC
jgi:valyl-tRNA synthetase